MADRTYLDVLQDQTIEQTATLRHEMSQDAAQRRANFYQRMHKFYAPPDGDQWIEDRIKRPNKFHITANIVKSFVDIESRVLSIMPRVTNKPPVDTLENRQKSEIAEKMNERIRDDLDFDVFFADFCRIASLYGRAAARVFWDTTVDLPAVALIEQPQNLIVGWGTSDFTVMDWAMYEYKISPLEAHLQYPDIEILPPAKKGGELLIARRDTDHTDPLDQKMPINSLLAQPNTSLRRYVEGAYESKQIVVWDYWYKNPEGVISNALLLQGKLARPVREHPEFPILPYIVAENDHEPGSPEGMSSAEVLIDLQMVLNVVFSLWTQVVADDTEPAWQLTGDADAVPAGLVPSAGKIVAPGAGARIEKIDKAINQYPAQLLVQEVWNTAHRITGISEIMFGNASASVDSARVLATQIEAAQNRLDPKRRRRYAALRTIFQVWSYMLEKKNPKVKIGSVPTATAPGETPSMQEQEVGVGDYLKGFNHWKIIAPEITPRDSVESTNNAINKITANLMPRIQAMDEIGIENPEETMALILKELANPRLNPAAVQAFTSVLATLQSIEAQSQAQQAAQNPQGAVQNGAGAVDQANAANQAAAPSGLQDQNNPATGIGGPPPPGAPVPGGVGELQPLVRQTAGGQSESLSQIKLTPTKIG